LFSCTKDEIIEKDFSGTYSGVLTCEGTSYLNGKEIELIITKGFEGLHYTVDLGDDVIFNATQKENVLTIYKQTLNEGGDVDVITLEATFTFNDNDDLVFKFKHKVDDEPENNCEGILKKK